jgi:hypothetical protein
LKYNYRDGSIEPGTTYWYRVEIEQASGQRALLFETEPLSTPSVPLALFQNHPNPFNPSTVISYYLPYECEVTLSVYDSSGRLIETLERGARMTKGNHSVEWNGRDAGSRDVSSGVYFYRLQTGREMISKKMVLMR